MDDAVREWRAALWSRDDSSMRVRLAQALLRLNPPLRAEARNELRAALRGTLPADVREQARKLLQSLEPPDGKGGHP
jgi:hypothetical protein